MTASGTAPQAVLIFKVQASRPRLAFYSGFLFDSEFPGLVLPGFVVGLAVGLAP